MIDDVEADAMFPEQTGSGHVEVPDLAFRPGQLNTLSQAIGRIGHGITLPDESPDTPVLLQLGVKLRLERLRHGLSQEQLAERVGISQPMLSNIELGKGSEGPTWTTMRNLTSALHLKLVLDREWPPASKANGTGDATVGKTKHGTRVRGAMLGDDGVSLVKALVSKADLNYLNNALLLKAKLRKPVATNPGRVCVWAFGPGSKRTFPAGPDLVLVVQGPDGVCLRRRGSTKVSRADSGSVELIGSEDVVVANAGPGKSTVFSVAAADLLSRRTGT